MHPLSALIHRRASTPRLGLPVPPADVLEEALACAMRAPDHGRLRPWRFHVLEGDERSALGQCFEAAARSDTPALEEAQARRLRDMPLRAPMIIIASARIVTGHKVPEWEQVVAVGAAVQNLSLALEAHGFASMWRTGEMAAHPVVKAALGLGTSDRIVGFLYVGTALEQATPAVDAQSAARIVHGLRPVAI